MDKEKIKEDTNVQEIKGKKAKILEITVAGVPKSRRARFKKFIRI